MPGVDRAVVGGSPGVQVDGQGAPRVGRFVRGDVGANDAFAVFVRRDQQRRCAQGGTSTFRIVTFIASLPFGF
eukprot:894500-Prorocentrum_minimum.AAC.2